MGITIKRINLVHLDFTKTHGGAFADVNTMHNLILDSVL